MRPFLRWIVHGKPPPPLVLRGEWSDEDPRTDALVSMAASMERFVVAAESVAARLERAEKRALKARGELMGEHDGPARPEEELSERASIAPDAEVPEEIEERLRREREADESLELEE